MNSELDKILEDMLCDNMSDEDRVELRRVIRAVQAKYEVGQRVHVHGIADGLTVVERDVYGPSEQWYGLENGDADWMPPPFYTINVNYGRLRLFVHLNDIRQDGDEDKGPERQEAYNRRLEGLEMARARVGL